MRHDILELFDADPTVLHLNTGAFGMVPRTVRAAQQRWSDRIEANPVRFFRLECHDELQQVRHRVTDFLGAQTDSVALIRNVSEAVGVILDAIDLRAGDDIVVSDHGYPTVALAAGTRGAAVRTASFGIEASDAEIAAAFAAQVGEHTRLVVVDAVTSPTGLELPVRAVVEAVAPVPVYVDAAHSAGTTELEIEVLGAAFWATNLHKWCYTPRGTGALWTDAPWRDRALPAVTSWTSYKGYPGAHDFPGTVDFSAMLAIPDGLDFWAAHGGLEIARRNRELLSVGSELVHRRLAMAFPGDMPGFDPSWPGRAAPGMRLVPLPDGLIESADDAAEVYERLSDRGIECPPAFWGGRSYLRLGSGLHVDELDYDRLAETLVATLRGLFA